jgi:hypothetical protein
MLLDSLHRADSVITLDRFMAQRVADKSIPSAKIFVLPPWSHDHVVRYDPPGREHFRALHGLSGKFVVMYSGNHSPCHPLATLLDAARLLAPFPEITFCFVGGGSEFEKVKTFTRRHNLSNIVTLPYQPFAGLAASLSSADLHVVVMGDPFVGIVHPCKVYNIRTLGIPYLYIGPAAGHIAEMNPYVQARHGDVEAVIAGIRRAFDSQPAAVASSGDTFQHSQARLVSRLAAKLESLSAPREKSEVITSTWKIEREY